MLSSTDIVRRAHGELDRVVGPDRTPEFEDEPNLPYIRGIIKETLRMRPINKFGNNHCNIEDDWYNGYFIPKDTVVMVNWWSIHYNPKYYPEPDRFRPERWIGYEYSASQAAALPDGNMRDHLTYGGGRRICAGIHLAEKSLYINVARLLWGFDLGLAEDENGREVKLDFETSCLQPGSTSVPKPFPCEIKPRSERHENLLRQEWSTARENGIDLSHIKWSV